MNKYDVVIGLEVHVQLRTASKMFCCCDNLSVDTAPNTNVCPICLGMPGMLPVPNKKAIEWTYLFGLAVGAIIPKKWNFERKNYFYPDLPKAYQITSSTNPPVIGGRLEVDLEGNITKVRIHHTHLEEDAGKLVHPTGANYSLVDLNRAGTPLMEIVTEPDIRSPREASVFLQDLRSILRYLGISDANMEQGNLRCDANISLRPEGQKEYGTKVEIKNMNSFKMIERALEYEVKRQSDILEAGKQVVQETRGWDDTKGITTSQRSKEEANDYRYFPEPDLPPFVTDAVSINIDEIRNQLPELPKEICARLISEYGLSQIDSKQLTTDIDLAKYFEKSVEALPEDIFTNDDKRKVAAKKLTNWITGELIGRMNKSGVQLSDINILPEQLTELIVLIDSGSISGKQAKEVFDQMFEKGDNPKEIIKQGEMGQISDVGELEVIINQVLKANTKSVEDYKSGKQQSFGYLIGQVMYATGGKANPQKVNEILRERLSK